jgi:superoxide dismutase, Cu-Zn family
MQKILVVMIVFFIGWAPLTYAYTAKAVINPTSEESQVSGVVILEDQADGLKISASLSGVTPGNHGFHVHTFGSCEDAGKAAGGHFNPKGNPHGFLPQDGAANVHAGDMGNVVIAEDGTGELELLLEDLVIADGEINVAGRAFILHAKPDDFGQPTGNAGSRIGCGVIAITGE